MLVNIVPLQKLFRMNLENAQLLLEYSCPYQLLLSIVHLSLISSLQHQSVIF